MRDPKRIDEMLSKLAELWKLNPDLRLGQLISNLTRGVRYSTFYVEDDQMLKFIVDELEAERLRCKVCGFTPNCLCNGSLS